VVVPDREFPANVYPWRMLDDRGVRLELLPLTAEGWPNEEALLQRVADPRVRVLAVSLVQFHNGYRIDLARLGRRCRETDTVLVVDAIQGIGIVPCDLGQMEVDFLACGAQKWLLSPWGSGFLYVNRRWLDRLRPPFAGWTAFEGTDDFADLCRYETRWRADSRRFELVTLPFQDFVGMNASLELLLEVGVDRIGGHVRATHEPVLAWADRRGVRVASPRDSRGSGILALALADPQGARETLQQAGIGCSVREGLLRFSPHCYTSVADMERVVEVLERALG
jgi:selenocysteine lyase/cysteine desulfurase